MRIFVLFGCFGLYACEEVGSLLQTRNQNASRLQLVESGRTGAADTSRPQLVVFTHDDALTQEGFDNTHKVPVPWTYFINVVAQHGGWEYNESLLDIDCSGGHSEDCMNINELVYDTYMLGHEIAMHTYTHPFIVGGEKSPMSQELIEREIQQNYDFLVEDCGVNGNDIKGWRAPFLSTQAQGAWNIQDYNKGLQRLQLIFNKLGVTWASSMSTPVESPETARKGVRFCLTTDGGWDYTMCDYTQQDEFPWPQETGGYPYFTDADEPKSWQLFMDMKEYEGGLLDLMDTVFGYSMLHGDVTAAKAMDIWYSNFERHYTGSRAHMGVWIHSQSVSVPEQVQGMIDFVNKIKDLEDVYIVTSSQAVNYEIQKPPREEWDTFFANNWSKKAAGS